MILNLDQSSNTLTLSDSLTRETITHEGWLVLDESVKRYLVEQKQANFNLAALSAIDSAGLAWLLNFKRDAAVAQVNITFGSVPDKLTKLAALSSVGHLLTSEC